MSEFKEYTVQDVIELVIDYRGKTPKKLGGDWSDSGYRAFSAKNVKTGKIVQPDTIRYVSTDMYKKWMKDEVQRGDIFITSEAPFGQIYYWDSDEKIVLSQRLFAVRTKKEFYDKYIYFYMTTPAFQGELENRSTGTTVTGLRQPELLKTALVAPDFDTQVKIADFLYKIEQKININEQINRNLSEQADTLYKDYFVTNADERWKAGHLSDLITVKYGKDHKKLEDGTIPCYGSGGVMRYVERPLYDKESVLIPRKGTLNNVMYVNTPFWSVDTMFYTVMKVQNAAKFIFHFVKEKDLASMNAGSAVPSMTTDILNALELIIPSAEALEKFESIVAPLYKAIQYNDAESKKLAELRDILLPKLISGELDVSDLEI